MKKIKILLFFVLFGTLNAFAQRILKDQNKIIGYCNANVTLASTKEFQEIQKRTSSYEKEIDRLTKEVSEKVEKFKSSGNDPKMQEQAQASYQKMEEYKMKAYQEVENLKQRLLPTAQTKISNAIKTIAKQKGLKVVMDSGAVLYIENLSEDITDLVITELKKSETQVYSPAIKK